MVNSSNVVPPEFRPRLSRVQAWYSIGIPNDPEAATRRLDAYRQRRSVRKSAASMTFSCSPAFRELLDQAARRHRVSASMVCRKAIELWLEQFAEGAA